jgi:hypothetical protein
MNQLYLEVEVNSSRDCASFYFKDITPEYSAVSSPNGYDPTGISCASPSNLTDITVAVSKVNSTSGAVTINIPTTSPTFDSTRIPGVVDYEITSTNLGYTITDGIYQFVYSVVDSANNDQVYQRTCYVLNDCAICCELEQRLKDIKSCGSCNELNSRSVNLLYEAYMLRQKAHHLVACLNFTGAQEVIDYLNRLLDLQTCDSCN